MPKVCCLSEQLILSAGIDGAMTRLGSCISSLISWRHPGWKQTGPAGDVAAADSVCQAAGWGSEQQHKGGRGVSPVGWSPKKSSQLSCSSPPVLGQSSELHSAYRGQHTVRSYAGWRTFTDPGVAGAKLRSLAIPNRETPSAVGGKWGFPGWCQKRCDDLSVRATDPTAGTKAPLEVFTAAT